MEYLTQLNEAQKKAVLHIDGPTLIVASAGSGKTRVVTYRIAHLLQIGVHPPTILALTFTNKAAQNMEKRIALIVGEDVAKYLWMGTFHSIFSRILRYEADCLHITSNYTIYDMQDSLNLIKTIVKEMQLNDKDYIPNVIQKIISSVKTRLINPQAYKQNKEFSEIDTYKGRPLLWEIYQRYVNRCKQADAMDFDDLLMHTAFLFENHPEVLKKYQNRFQYILVDEFQDTNYAQNHILHQLAKPHHNICVVGDDAQSIYSFRGANITNILNFKNEYPNYTLFKLEQNYRSVQNIVKAANSVIRHNKNQIKKSAYSHKETGEKIDLLSAMTDTEEGFLVAQALHVSHLREQLPYDSFAILYRTNAQSRIFEEALRKKNIPYRIFGGLSFYQRKEVKDLLAYFRFILNPYDEEALKRIINYPKRGIGSTTVNKLLAASREQRTGIWDIIRKLSKNPYGLNKGTINKLLKFMQTIEDIRKLQVEKTAYEIAQHICSQMKIIELLNTDKTPEGISRYQNVKELLNGLQEFSDTALEEGSPGDLSTYLYNVSLLTNLDEEDPDMDKVTLMTIHSSKGLEFEHTFIVGLEDDLLPVQYNDSISEWELEEERRLFYVALTRAKKKVTLSYAKMRYKWGKPTFTRPSRFIDEIDEQYINKNPFSVGIQTSHKSITTPTFTTLNKRIPVLPESFKNEYYEASILDQIQVGMDVSHARFGKGKVLSIEGQTTEKKATVFFQNRGQKVLLLKYAKLKILE